MGRIEKRRGNEGRLQEDSGTESAPLEEIVQGHATRKRGGSHCLLESGLFRGLLGLAVVLSLGSAACMDAYGSKRALARSIDDFNAQVRWGRQEQAAAYLTPRLRKEYLDRVERLGEKIGITGVEILRVIARQGGKEALVRLRFKWQRRDEIILRQTLLVETWRKVGKGWVLVRIRQLTKPIVPILPPGPRAVEVNEER